MTPIASFSSRTTASNGLSALASLAIDNARLYEKAQRELRERQVVEEDLRSSEGRFRKVFKPICLFRLKKSLWMKTMKMLFWITLFPHFIYI